MSLGREVQAVHGLPPGPSAPQPLHEAISGGSEVDEAGRLAMSGGPRRVQALGHERVPFSGDQATQDLLQSGQIVVEVPKGVGERTRAASRRRRRRDLRQLSPIRRQTRPLDRDPAATVVPPNHLRPGQLQGVVARFGPVGRFADGEIEARHAVPVGAGEPEDPIRGARRHAPNIPQPERDARSTQWNLAFILWKTRGGQPGRPNLRTHGSRVAASVVS